MGLPQDAHDVRWTVYRNDGLASSGFSLQAVKDSTGEYFAPWSCSVSDGCFFIEWEYGVGPGLSRQSWRHDFFVRSGLSSCCPGSAPRTSAACHGVFSRGQVLGPSDLSLVVFDDDGIPSSAFLVFWTILDSCNRPVTQRTQASPGLTNGSYYASWTVFGSYGMSIRWEWMLDADSPIESVVRSFSVIVDPFSNCDREVSNWCSPSPPPQIIIINNGGSCGDHQRVSRVQHLPTQVLPPGGLFTNQASYSIPNGISKIAFYITYTRAVPGGFCVIRLKWGNGVEETQATVLLTSSTPGDQVMRLSDLMGPIPEDDLPSSFMLETSVPGGASTVRLLAAEGGVIGLPGTASISLTGS
jgi:hypothetical protein